MIDALLLFPKDEHAQVLNEIGRKKLASLRDIMNALKHALAKLRLRRNALHHGGEKYRRCIALLRREPNRYQEQNDETTQSHTVWPANARGKCNSWHLVTPLLICGQTQPTTQG